MIIKLLCNLFKATIISIHVIGQENKLSFSTDAGIGLYVENYLRANKGRAGFLNWENSASGVPGLKASLTVRWRFIGLNAECFGRNFIPGIHLHLPLELKDNHSIAVTYRFSDVHSISDFEWREFNSMHGPGLRVELNRFNINVITGVFHLNKSEDFEGKVTYRLGFDIAYTFFRRPKV